MNKAKIARVANEGPLSRRGRPKISEQSDLDELIAWLEWNDPNGDYRRDDVEDALDEDEAWQLVRDTLRDDL